MADTFEFTLNNPLTEEQWDMIADVDFDHTDRIWFNTKHGKEVEFTKVIRCKECRKQNKRVGFDENFKPVYKEDACPLASWRGIAKGHEFDYQFCCYAERKTE